MSAGSPISRPLDVVVHVGMRKTGTSSIQFFLRDNRQRLAELGILFPKSPGAARHEGLGLFFQPEAELATSLEWGRQKQPDMATFRRTFRRRLFAEIEASGLSRLLLTDEVLFGSSDPTLQRMGWFTHRIGRSVREVVYLRRQDDHMISRYQQEVKVGEILRLCDWIDDDPHRSYDYFARLRRHEELVAPTELVVRRYEAGSFADGSLLQDFLDAAGIDARAADMEQGPDRNRSLDAESVEFLRLLNLHRVENEGAKPRLIDNRKLTAKLTEASGGAVLSLPNDRLDAFMARWEQSNELVARRYVHDPGGTLFRAPRKSGEITTEQRLDPSRLEHFLRLLELPETVHDPLRRIAEREARRR